MTSTDTQEKTYRSILSTLLPAPSPSSSMTTSTSIPQNTLPLPLYPSPVHTPIPLHANLTPQIARLRLHPSVEAALHILNNDLPAAHFLVRHMQDVVPRDKGERRSRERGQKDGGRERSGDGDGDGDGDEKNSDEKEAETKGDNWCRPGKTWAQLAAGNGDEEAASEQRSVNGNDTSSHSAPEYASSVSKSSNNNNNTNDNGDTKNSNNNNNKINENSNIENSKHTPPKLEGLLLHALLHRIEGDYENARAWYTNVDAASTRHRPASSFSSSTDGLKNSRETQTSSADYKDAWTSTHPHGLPALHRTLDRIIGLRARIHPSPSPPHVLPASATDADREELAELEQWHWEECRAVVGWCEGRYGCGVWEDGRDEFVGTAEGHREVAGRMITGGEGWRQF